MRARCCLLCIAILTAGLASDVPAKSAVRWQPNLELARKSAGESNRLVLVHFWSNGCLPCLRMEREVFSQPDVAAAIEATYAPVRVNVQLEPELARRFGVNCYPTDVVLTPDGEVLRRFPGFVDAASYKSRLGQLASQVRMQASRVYGSIAADPPVGAPASGYDRVGRPAESATPPVSDAISSQTYPPNDSAASAPIGSQYSAPSGSPVASNGRGVDTGSRSMNYRTETPPAQPNGYAVPPWQDSSSRQQSDSSLASRGPSLPTGGHEYQGSSSVRPRTATVNPPLALDGYCPVSLCDHERWVKGNPRFGVIHLGRTYLFAGPEEAKRFYNDPERYAPVQSGNDIVLWVNQGRAIPGDRKHGGWYPKEQGGEKRMYLFADEASYQKFDEDPDRYIAALKKPTATTAARPGTSAPSPQRTASRQFGDTAGSIQAGPSGNADVVPVNRTSQRY